MSPLTKKGKESIVSSHEPIWSYSESFVLFAHSWKWSTVHNCLFLCGFTLPFSHLIHLVIQSAVLMVVFLEEFLFSCSGILLQMAPKSRRTFSSSMLFKVVQFSMRIIEYPSCRYVASKGVAFKNPAVIRLTSLSIPSVVFLYLSGYPKAAASSLVRISMALSEMTEVTLFDYISNESCQCAAWLGGSCELKSHHWNRQLFIVSARLQTADQMQPLSLSIKNPTTSYAQQNSDIVILAGDLSTKTSLSSRYVISVPCFVDRSSGNGCWHSVAINDYFSLVRNSKVRITGTSPGAAPLWVVDRPRLSTSRD